jgi:pilus assembly protein CpaF
MEIKDIKKEMRRKISIGIERNTKLSRPFIRERIYGAFNSIEELGKVYLNNSTKEEIVNSLCNDFLGLGPLQPLMDDEEVTEIMVNGPYRVYVEKGGKKTLSNVKFDDEAHLRYIIEKMLAPTGRRLDESSPYVDFSLKDGSRVNVIIPPLAFGGAVVTIRKFLLSIRKIEDLIRLGTIDERIGEFLIACIKAKINVLFSGATGSGKTTTLGVLSSYIEPDERIITIEDALELNLQQEHIVRLLTRPPNIEGKGGISLRDLFRNTLRMRPTRIILGEIRGEEAMDYLQALNSGHRGCLAVIHASSPSDAIRRLETMCLYAGLNLPLWVVRQQICSGLDLIVQHEQFMDGSRKITYVTEVNGLKDERIVLEDIFRYDYDMEEVKDEISIKGKFKALKKPALISLLHKKGIKLKEDIFIER